MTPLAVFSKCIPRESATPESFAGRVRSLK